MKRKVNCIAAPVVTLGISLLIFFLYQLYPFALQTLAWCDMKQQVLPFLLDLKNILQGDSDFLLNLQNAGGMSFLGVFFFFISSPFSFLVLFIDASEIYLFANILVILKICACAFTASLFFTRYFPEIDTLQTIGLSVMYAFSGYTMLYFQNMVWLDVACMFPVLLMGLESLVRKGRIACYILSLSAIVVLNFYLTYMIVLFLIMASGIFLFYICPDHRIRRKGILLLGISTGLVILITSGVWLPSFLQYLASARTVGLIENLGQGKITTHFYTTLPILLCNGAVLSGVIGLFSFQRINSRELKGILILWILMVVPLFLDPVNKIWHTGSYQAFPARYGYITIFLGLILLAFCLSNLNREAILNRHLQRSLPSATILALMILAGVAFISFSLLKNRYQDLTAYTRTLWANKTSTVLLALFSSIIVLSVFLIMLLYRSHYLNKRIFSVVLSGILFFEIIFCSGIFIGSAANSDTSYRTILSLGGKLEQSDINRVKSNQKYFDVNLIGAMGYPTLNHYTSLTGKNFMFTMKKLGYSSYWMEVGSHGGTEWSDILMANHYTIKSIAETTAEDKILFQNDPYVLVESQYPALFGVPIHCESIEGLEFLPDIPRIQLQEYLFDTILQSNQDLITEYMPSHLDNIIFKPESNSISLEILEKAGTFVYNIWIEGDQSLYFDCFDQLSNRLSEPIYNSFTLKINGDLYSNVYPVQNNNGFLNLGTYSDEIVQVEITCSKQMSPKSFGIFSVNTDVLLAAAQEKKNTEFSQQGNKLVGMVTAAKGEEYLFLPLPYDKGYSVTVNQKPEIVFPVFDGFMAIPLTEGDNRIILTYVPRGLEAGIILSCFGILAFISTLVFLRKNKYCCMKRLETMACWIFIILFFGTVAAVYIFPLIVYWVT